LQKDYTGWSQIAKDERSHSNKAVKESKYSTLDESKTTNLTSYLANVSDTLTKLSTASQAYSAILSAADFNLMLSAMKTDSDIVVLSNPRVIVQENYAAEINIGKKWPILESTSSDQGGYGGFSIDYWQDIGILLKVIPQVRDSGRGGKDINMIVHPAVSTQSGVVQAGAGEYVTEYPIISLREADTNVTVSDGDTLVIGGLISSLTQDEESKIPLLGDIPILGYLFKEKHKVRKKTNLLIFITARIVSSEAPLSTYEKMILEKAPPDALEDVRYTKDPDLRPYLYKKPGTKESSLTPRESNPGRKVTKAMKRSKNR
jgi:general secretion pathway protein D